MKIEIVNNYTVLHFDEYPILFIGKNYKSETVIGSFICEDDGENAAKYFHSIVASNFVTKFLNREISYLDVLKAASSISIVTKNHNGTVLKVEEKDFSEIDKSFLPLPSAYCPVVEKKTIKQFDRLVEKPLTASYSISTVSLSLAEPVIGYENTVKKEV